MTSAARDYLSRAIRLYFVILFIAIGVHHPDWWGKALWASLGMFLLIRHERKNEKPPNNETKI